MNLNTVPYRLFQTSCKNGSWKARIVSTLLSNEIRDHFCDIVYRDHDISPFPYTEKRVSELELRETFDYKKNELDFEIEDIKKKKKNLIILKSK